jgi:RNA polymerase sigma-70 factor (ECF subfamily)
MNQYGVPTPVSTKGADIDFWFAREVLPLELHLTRFLRRNWNNESEIADLRQEVYVRVCDSARGGAPRQIKPFLFAVARNLIVDLARRGISAHSIGVPKSTLYDQPINHVLPDHEVSAGEQLQLLAQAMSKLPARCREVVLLRRLEGLTQRETAARMGIREHTVERQMSMGMRKLSKALGAGNAKPMSKRLPRSSPSGKLSMLQVSDIAVSAAEVSRRNRCFI